MELINIYNIFEAIENEKYCIVKYKDFDTIEPGSDIDIFSFDVYSASKKIIDAIEKQIFGNKEMKIHVSSYETVKCYIDIIKNGKIYLRLDMCGELPEYSRVLVKPGLFECCVEKAEIEKIKVGDKTIPVKKLARDQDLLIRYLEYIEWYERRPDKIKHLNYVLDVLESESDRKRLLNDLHYYTDFPYVKYQIKKGKTGVIENIKFILEKCKGKSVSDLWAIFRQKFL